MASNNNGGGGGGVASALLTALCCLWICREATRPTDTVTVVEERTIVTPGGRRVRRTKRYKNRSGFYESDDPTVIVVNKKAGLNSYSVNVDKLPLVACTHHSRMER